MITNIDDNFITLKTDFDGSFKISISNKNGAVIFCEVMTSNNQQIHLEGFSLKEHTVTISPIK